MRVQRLALQNFRNYERLEASFDPGVNLIVGDNAQGKTNLLEALVYLSQGGSYRTRREEELIRWDQDFARLEAEILTSQREVELVYALFRGPKRRQIMLNGVKQKNASEAEDCLNTVLFCPEDLQILRAGASVRRKFLDNAISQLRPKYKKAVADYQKLYESKSRILRDHFTKPSLLDGTAGLQPADGARRSHHCGLSGSVLQKAWGPNGEVSWHLLRWQRNPDHPISDGVHHYRSFCFHAVFCLIKLWIIRNAIIERSWKAVDALLGPIRTILKYIWMEEA